DGSVVTRDITANSLAVGNPCKVIRQITDQDDIRLKKELF
ncbi:MAG: sugar O-acetyltransferase, partial [Lactiplantibacillus plantarum]|nr:sugar O-acetyltransferase [Lactiplantibacillus plantarum]